MKFFVFSVLTKNDIKHAQLKLDNIVCLEIVINKFYVIEF